MTTAERLALAVLKGDKDAVAALWDAVGEEHGFYEGGVRGQILVPIRRLKIDAPAERLRAFVYLREGLDPTEEWVERMEQGIEEWMRGDSLHAAIVLGIERIELYELPEFK
jgi:hypothetical protein